MTLEEARLEINAVDEAIAALFERRMTAVRDVIAYKIEHDLPIFDAAREEQVIENNCKRIQDPELVEYFKEFLISQMALSKKYQKEIFDRTTM